MVRTVVQRHLDVLDRVASDGPVPHRLGDPLLDGGNESLRDDAALDRVHELQAAAGLAGLELDVAVTELAATPRLLLVAPVRLGGSADRLLIGDAGRVQVDLGAEAELSGTRAIGPTGRLTLGVHGLAVQLTGGMMFDGDHPRYEGAAQIVVEVMDLTGVM